MGDHILLEQLKRRDKHHPGEAWVHEGIAAIEAELHHTTPAPTPTPTPTPPAPNPTPAPAPTPSPTSTPSGSGSPQSASGLKPGAVLAFAGGSPSDPVSGGEVLVTWAELEPTEGTFAWSVIEGRCAPWFAAGKHVAIRIQHVLGNGTQASPQWLLDRVGVVDAALFVPDYFNAAYAPARLALMAAVGDWLNTWQHRDGVAWFEWGVGIYGETKVDSEQGHTIDLSAWQSHGYTDAAWDALVVAEVGNVVKHIPLSIPVVIDMDRSFIGGDPNFTAEKLGAQLRAVGAWLGDHGYRENVTPEAMYLDGPSIFEQYLSSAKTGNDPNVELQQMHDYAVKHGGYVLLYGSDIPHCTTLLEKLL